MKKNKKNPDACMKKTSIGGQALMEGIMMRGPEMTAMAVINTKGEMVVEKFPTETKQRSKFFKLPIIRGVVGYFDSMAVGTKCLMRSAELSGLEEAEEELRREKEAKKAKRDAKRTERNKTERNSKKRLRKKSDQTLSEQGFSKITRQYIQCKALHFIIKKF